jgi:HK97 family phage major capsid protein
MTETVIPEIKSIQDSLSKLVTEIQSVKNNSADPATIKNLQDAIDTQSGQYAELVAKHEAQVAEVKQLEALLARTPGKRQEDGEPVLSSPEYKSIFYQAVKDVNSHGFDQAAHTAELKNYVNHYMPYASDTDKELAVKTLAVGAGPGSIITPLDATLRISKRIFESSPVRQLATVIQTGADAVPIVVDDDDLSYGWASEFTNRAESDMTGFNEVQINLYEAYAYPKASQRFVDNPTINVESYVSDKVSGKFARVEGAGWINGTGDGGKQMRGMLTYSNWANPEIYEFDKLAAKVGATATLIGADDLLRQQGMLLEDYQSNANWLMNRQTWAGSITTLKDLNNNYLINPQMLFSGAEMQLLGRPVKFAPQLATPTGAGAFVAGQIPVLYGDFREGYTMAEKFGIRLVRDPYTTKGVVKWYFSKLLGGAVTNFQAIKQLKIS